MLEGSVEITVSRRTIELFPGDELLMPRGPTQPARIPLTAPGGYWVQGSARLPVDLIQGGGGPRGPERVPAAPRIPIAA